MYVPHLEFDPHGQVPAKSAVKISFFFHRELRLLSVRTQIPHMNELIKPPFLSLVLSRAAPPRSASGTPWRRPRRPAAAAAAAARPLRRRRTEDTTPLLLLGTLTTRTQSEVKGQQKRQNVHVPAFFGGEILFVQNPQKTYVLPSPPFP